MFKQLLPIIQNSWLRQRISRKNYWNPECLWKESKFWGQAFIQKWCNYCRRFGHSIAECRHKQQDNLNRPPKNRELNIPFYQYMIKDQSFLNKGLHSNKSSGNPLPNSYNIKRSKSPCSKNFRGRPLDRRYSQNCSQNRYSRSNSQKDQYRSNYSRSNSKRSNYSIYNKNCSYSNRWSKNYPKDRSRTSRNDRNRNRYCSYNNSQNYSDNRPHNN